MRSHDSFIMQALRLQLAAVKQHFTHVLILEARGDKANAASINDIDSIDLPNAMQVVEHLVAQAQPFELCRTKAELLQSMPMPGFSDADIIASERRLEGALGQAIERCLQSARASSDETVRGLMTKSLEPRPAYAGRLTDWENEIGQGNAVPSRLTDAQSQWIDRLFATMMVVIDQTMVHAFVHRHSGETEKAGMAWEVSGAAMMQATALTKGLAARGLAANPAVAVKRDGAVPHPRMAFTSVEAEIADRELAAHCVKLCSDGVEALGPTEFQPLVTNAKTYFAAVCNRKEGERLPTIPNPCRDFERTLSVYVRGDNFDQTG